MIEKWATDAVESWGYLGLSLLILIENLFPPIPSELILPLAGYYVESGELSYVPAVLAATAGSVLGAIILYWISRLGGQPILLKMAPLLRLDAQDILRIEDKFRAHGNMYVFFGRLIPGVRSIVSIPAGLSAMPFGRFIILTTVGSALWNSLLIGIGWGLGSQYEKVSPIVGPISRVVLVVVVVGTAYWIIKTALNHRKSGSAPKA